MRRQLSNIAPLVLVVVGLAILLYPTISNFLIERNASRAVERYSEERRGGPGYSGRRA